MSEILNLKIIEGLMEIGRHTSTPFFSQQVKIFKERSTEFIQTLHTDSSDQLPTELVDTLHKFTGYTAYLGLERLSKLSRKVEEDMASMSKQERMKYYSLLKDSIKESIYALEKILAA